MSSSANDYWLKNSHKSNLELKVLHTWPKTSFTSTARADTVFKGDEDKPYFNPHIKFPQLSSMVCAKEGFLNSQGDSEQLKPQNLF